jgi:hypothetical protein
MDNITLRELKRVVEQAVRPVRATMARKRRVREELLAHLVAIFEEETGRLGDEQAALEQAKQRFGDPRELVGQIQQTVPWWDRCRSIFESMGCQPGESAWHLAGKHFLVMLTIYSGPMLALTMMLAFGKFPNMGPMEAQHMLAKGFLLGLPMLALFNVILSLISASLLNKIGPALASKLWGRILLASLCVLVLLCSLHPLLTGAALLLILMARQTVKQWRYQSDWA